MDAVIRYTVVILISILGTAIITGYFAYRLGRRATLASMISELLGYFGKTIYNYITKRVKK